MESAPLTTRSRRAAVGTASPRRPSTRRRKTDITDVSVSESDAADSVSEMEIPRAPASSLHPVKTGSPSFNVRLLSAALLRLDLRLLGKDVVVWRRAFMLLVIVLAFIFLWNNRQSAPSFTWSKPPPSSPHTATPISPPSNPSLPSALDQAAHLDLKQRLDAVEKELRSLAERSTSSNTAVDKRLQEFQTTHSNLEKRVTDAQSANSVAEKRCTDAQTALDKRVKEEHDALFVLKGRYEDTSATVTRLVGYAGPQGSFPELSNKLKEEMAALIKEVSERLKTESAARMELAAEFTRYKAAAPVAKEEAEEKLRGRVRALVVELLPSLAPSAPSPSGAPAPPPTIREWKLVDHRSSLETLILEVLKREHDDFKDSLLKHKVDVQTWATDAVAPDIRRLDARDRELEKIRAAEVQMPSTAPSPAPVTNTGAGISEARIAELIDAALEQYAADRVALPDFALESGGASIVRWRTSSTYRSHAWLPIPRPLGPSTALQPDVAVGRCFAFPGSQGNITVRLPTSVQVSAVTIDHASARIAHSLGSAPRDFAVWGMHHETDEHENMKLIGKWHYDTKASHAVQTFAAKNDLKEAFSFVLLQVLSNHGHEDFTCLYRFRVHGTEVHEKY